MRDKTFQVVIDTNVIVSALRSQYGASFKLFSLIGHRQFSKFEINVSVALALEYEEVLSRNRTSLNLRLGDAAEIVNFLCQVANRRNIFFLWRPFLQDKDDDFILELAVESNCDFVVTFNEKDFVGLETFGIKTVRPADFLEVIGEQG